MSTVKELMDRVARSLQPDSMRDLQEYLIGGGSEAKRSKIERRIVEDEQFFQELLAAEDMLVPDYIRELLPSDLKSAVTDLANRYPAWRQKIAFARATRLMLERKPGAGTRPDNEWVEVLYDELRTMATHTLTRERPGSLDPAELVNEVYLRMANSDRAGPRDKPHFLATAAALMRRVLVNGARASVAAKRDRSRGHGSDAAAWPVEEQRLLELDFALHALGEQNPRASLVVEMRFFGGLNFDEIASALGISTRTVKRDWMLARSWLHSYLGGTDAVQ